MNMLSRDGSWSTMDRVVGAAKRNPEGLLLLAAGCALLMRGGGTVRQAWRGSRTDGSHRTASSYRRYEADDDMHDRREDTEQRGAGVVDTAREYASDLAGRVTQSAESAMHYASDARRTAVEQTGRFVRQTRSGAGDAMERMINDQPLTVALVGLAAGALLASALPGTRMERRALQPVGERLSETAEEARRRLKRSASKVGERLEEMAEERGLAGEGLKNAAREVASTFGEELISRDDDTSSSQKVQSASTGSGSKGASASTEGPASTMPTVGQTGTEMSRKNANGTGNTGRSGQNEAGRTDRSS